MSADSAPSFDLSVKISDLTSASHLKSLLEGNAWPEFKFAAELAPHWDKQVGSVPAGTKAVFNLSQAAKWKTATGIGFGLTETVGCELDIVKKGCCVQYADAIGSDPKAGIPAEDYSGFSYVKLSINFQIDGNISGTGSIGAFGISGNAKGSTATSLIFAHKVANSVLLKDALHEAFEKFVFPLQPSCSVDMAAGDIAAVTYNGSLSCSFDLSYGIAKYHFSAPSVRNTLECASKGMANLTLPTGTIDLGASVNIGYTHSDDFTAIVQKTGASDASLLLLRAHKNDITAGGGLAAKINIKQHAGVKLDQQKLTKAFDGITKGHGARVAAEAQDLQQQLNNKADNWVDNEIKNGVTLQGQWDRQTSTTLLFKYHVDLASPALCDKSWDYFCQGDIVNAVGAGGLTLDPGSGIDNQLSRSFTISVNFFNFFSVEDVDKYFEDSKVVITDTGDVRFVFDVGKENDTEIGKVLEKAKIHFTADATAKTGAEVKLYLELSESKNEKGGERIANVTSYLAYPATNAAADIKSFLAKQSAGTVNLTCILDASSYGKLTASEYVNGKPPQDLSADERNWQVFHDAALALLDVPFAQIVNYKAWASWSAAANGTNYADRRHEGDFDGSGASAIWAGQDPNMRHLLNYFCLAAANFMNLCDDLHWLANVTASIKIPDDWNTLLENLPDIVKGDVDAAYAKPAIASLLKLSAPSKVDYKKQQAGKTITCTLELS
jgi:hypothetical protein